MENTITPVYQALICINQCLMTGITDKKAIVNQVLACVPITPDRANALVENVLNREDLSTVS